MRTGWVLLFAAASLAVVPAAAQEHDHAAHAAAAAGAEASKAASAGAAGEKGMMQHGMMGGGMMGMQGMHVMSVTVTALDGKTGMVEASAGSMTLKLHFPPASLTGVKAGDKLSVHLGFSKL